MDHRSKYLNVSDGGHIENLGVYELLRRRCRYIIAIDGECDPDLVFPSLMRLQQFAAVDMDIRIEMNFLAAMEKTTESDALSYLGSALGSLGENLPGEQALAGAQEIVAAIEKTTYSSDLHSLRSALVAMTVRMEAEATFSVLKSLVCVGDTRAQVLAGLEKKTEPEKKTGQEFDGNLWKAVKWLEEQGIDVKNVPRFPIITPE